MTAVAEIFKEKKFPKWITGHGIFKEITSIKKVFPSVGLANFTQDCALDDLGPEASAKRLLEDIQIEMEDRADALIEFIKSKPKMGEERNRNGREIIRLLTLLSEVKVSNFISKNKDKLTLNIPDNISRTDNEKVLFKKGESLFRVYNKLNESLKENKFARLSPVEEMASFKIFSSENVSNKKLQVVFSSTGTNGAWDIATMSMRGIKSCQSWDGEYHHCVIGSILDPFTGIVYLTSGGKTEHGTKMIRRCIVRFVVDEETKKPFLFLDYMYPNVDQNIINLFKKTLKEKTNGKLDVFYCDELTDKKLRNVFTPFSEIGKKINDYELDPHDQDDDDDEDYALSRESIRSYQDTRIAERKKKISKDNAMYQKNARVKTRNFAIRASRILMKSFETLEIGDDTPAMIKKMKKTLAKKDDGYRADNKSYIEQSIKDASHKVIEEILKHVDKSKFSNSDTLMRKVYFHYLSNKPDLMNLLVTKSVQNLNKNLKFKKDVEKLTKDDLYKIVNSSIGEIDLMVKDKLKEIVNKKINKISVLPLP